MPGRMRLDLASLWHREVRLVGAYAYGSERFGDAAPLRTFDLAMELVGELAQRLGAGGWSRRAYPLDRFEEALAHAGRRGTPGRGEGGLRRPRRIAGQAATEGATATRDERMPDEPPARIRPRGGRLHPTTCSWHGEGYRLEKLPEGSRVAVPARTVDALADPVSAPSAGRCGSRWATAEPLRALLRPGMRLTIAFDDVSLPLPPMRAPDVRQLVIEQVLEMAADAGVDDVVLIAALALHRRMTEAELRHALGDRVYDAFAPHGLLRQHDAEDPDNLVHLGLTDQGEDVEINKRAATSDLLVYVNINLVAMDGGHKSVATGLASYRSLRHHHNAQTMRHSRSFMDQHRRRSCTPRTGAWAGSSPPAG